MTPPPSTFSILHNIMEKKSASPTKSPVKAKSIRTTIDVTKILPKNMYKQYESLDLPQPPAKIGNFERDVYITLNLARADPVFFVNNFLEPVRGRFFKSFLYRDFNNVIRHTDEGIDATNHIIEYLSKTADKTPALTWDQDLADLAKDIISSVELDSPTMINSSKF